MTAFGELAAMAFPNVIATFGQAVTIRPQLVDQHLGSTADPGRAVVTVQGVLRDRLEKPTVGNAWDAPSLSRRPTMAGECSLKVALGALPYALRRGDIVEQVATGALFDVEGLLAQSRSAETWNLARRSAGSGGGA